MWLLIRAGRSIMALALVLSLLGAQTVLAQTKSAKPKAARAKAGESAPASEDSTATKKTAEQKSSAEAKAQASKAGGTLPEEDDPSQEAKQEAAERYRQGVQAYQKGRYKDAIDLFLEADQLAPSPALSFNIARAYDKIHDVAGSLKYYKDYLRRSPEADDAEEVTQLIRKREQALEEKGVQQVTVITQPKGATILIDERPLGVTPWTGELAPGRHHLALRRRGYADTERSFELPAEHSKDLIIRLVPASAAPEEPLVPEPSASPKASNSSTPLHDPRADQKPENQGLGIWPWVTLGVGVGTLGASGAFELLRRSAEDDAKAAETQVDFARNFDSMNKNKKTARWLAGAGGGLVLISGVLFYLDLQTDDGPAVAAGCSSEGCMARYRGAF